MTQTAGITAAVESQIRTRGQRVPVVSVSVSYSLLVPKIGYHSNVP